MMKIILSIITILFFINVSFCADDPVVLSASVDHAKVTTGDIVRFTVKLETAKDVQLELPEIGEKIEGFRVVDFGAEKSQEDERIIVARWYKLQADLVGTYILPSVTLTYDKKSYKTSEVFVEVASVLNDSNKSAQDIRDIKDIIDLPRSLSATGIVLILLVVSLAIAFFTYRYIQKKNSEDVVSHIPEWRVAFRELDLLQNSKHLANKDIKKFHFQLSQIIRIYFESTFHLTTTDMTYEEIQAKISTVNSLDIKLKDQFLQIMKKTDMVKFSDAYISNEDSLSLLEESRNFVTLTKPEDAEAENSEEDMII